MASRLITFLAALLVTGCDKPKVARELTLADFSGELAMTHVRRLVGYGPRPSSSAALGRASTYIIMRLEEYGWHVEEQVFLGSTPRGPVQFRNIVGKTAKQTGAQHGVIIVASHYDTKDIAGMRFVGANDGGSSAGVLLEMARIAAHQPNLCFVFFDGEEAITDYAPNDGLYGSRFFVRQLKSTGRVSEVKAMILLDMVGDAGLNITIPPNSTGDLVQRAFEAASTLGYRDFFGYAKNAILDDHVPFLEAGIPAINLIDYEYGSAPGLNDYWHTEQDTLDKLSPRSLEIAGKTALRMISLLRGAHGKTPATDAGTRLP